jgi:hypothetical protein
MFNYKMSYSQADLDNHANQLNPDHYEYWHCREQPAPTLYTDSSDEDSYSSGENDCERRVIRPTLHIIDPKSVRWGVKYDKNTQCGYRGGGWPKDKKIVFPQDIDVWENIETAAVEYCPPQEIIDKSATTIQKWWQCVKKYPENNICKYRMDEALQTFHSIRKNKANIVKITKMLESLHLETSQLEEKFMNELKSRETYPFRKISKAFWDLPREGTVAWGETLIKEWSLRRYCYSTFHEECMKKVWYMHDYDYYCDCDCTDYPGYEPRIIKCRRKYGDGWHLKYLKN